ncbi:MAG: TIGR02186 family protein [Desulfopila sp.]
MRLFISTVCRRLALTVLLLAVPCLGAAADTTITVSPSVIDMGTQYNGVELTVTGEIPAGADLIVRLVGTPDDLHLREKGKVFGLLWMNVAKVTLTHVPSVSLTSASRPLDQLGEGAAPYRLAALTAAIGVKQEGKNPNIDIPHELLLLKIKEGLYHQTAGDIDLGPATGDRQRYTAHIQVPSTVKPGQYQLEAVSLHDGVVTGEASITITAALSGMARWINDLAYHKSLLYGIMATVVAIVFGLLIGLIFQSKEAH